MPLFYSIRDCEQYVYHYTSSTALLDHILPSNTIRFPRFSNTNDPREYKTWTFGFATRFDFGDASRSSELETRASELMKRRSRLFCTSLDGPNAMDASVDNIYDRGFCRPRMWAQYAENHHGTCLVFDRAKLDAHIRAAAGGEPVYSESVTYRNRSRARSLSEPDAFMLDYDAICSLGVEQALAIHLAAFYRTLFFEKAVDWADEREYRWLTYSPDDGDFVVGFGDSLAGILTGDLFPADRRNDLHDVLAARNVPIGVMNWKSGVPEVLPSLRLPPRPDQQGWPI